MDPCSDPPRRPTAASLIAAVPRGIGAALLLAVAPAMAQFANPLGLHATSRRGVG